MCLFRKNIFVAFFQTFSASDLLPRTTMSCYARSAGPLLLLLPPPRHPPGSWDTSGTWKGRACGAGRASAQAPAAGTDPGPPAAASPQGSSPGQAGLTAGEQGDAPQDWAGPSCQKTHSHRRSPIPGEVKKARNLERSRYLKCCNPNSLVYGREKVEGEAESSRKISPWVTLHRKRQILCLKMFLP